MANAGIKDYFFAIIASAWLKSLQTFNYLYILAKKLFYLLLFYDLLTSKPLIKIWIYISKGVWKRHAEIGWYVLMVISPYFINYEASMPIMPTEYSANYIWMWFWNPVLFIFNCQEGSWQSRPSSISSPVITKLVLLHDLGTYIEASALKSIRAWESIEST